MERVVAHGEGRRGAILTDCCSVVESWIGWCAFCGRQSSYAQVFLSDERPEARTASVTSSPYQAPAQATSGASGSERSALLPKATELHPTASGRQDLTHGRPKWAKDEQLEELATPKKQGKEDLKAKGRNASGASLAASEEGEFCSTCLEPYTSENPAIWTKCNHHFHLACIYEWMERKQTCPLCEREMSFEEVLS